MSADLVQVLDTELVGDIDPAGETVTASTDNLKARNLSTDEKIDAIERTMLSDLPVIEIPVMHGFTPGLYCRTVFMPKGSIVTSKIHRTEHFYVVHEGAAAVAIDGKPAEIVVAPRVGITEAGTRRVLIILEDTMWSTFHAVSPEEQGNVEAIERRIIEPRELEDGKTAFELYSAALEAAREIGAGENEPVLLVEKGG